MIALTCRLCGAPLSTTFVDLGMSPLSNAFIQRAQLTAPETFYPLTVYVCDRCLLVQLPVTERAEAIFDDNYIYFSSYSSSWLEHSRRYSATMTERFGLTRSDLVVELASNDGYLLQYFRDEGIPILGIEPSGSVARVAIEKRGIPTEICFFGVETAKRLRVEGKSASLIVANNVLAHVPSLKDFLGGIPILLSPNGVVTVEFPHLFRLIEECQFDTIYQEHYSYFSLGSAMRAFEAHDLRIFDVEELSTHGGSLRLFACHAGAERATVQQNIETVLQRERLAGLDKVEGYLGFQAKANGVKWELLEFLIEAKRARKRVVAYGAPAKGNTLLNYCGIRQDLIEFTVDRSPSKQGTYLPGTHIPVLAPEKLDEAKPDYIVVLPWNLREELTQQLNHVGSWGGCLVFAIPKLEIVSP